MAPSLFNPLSYYRFSNTQFDNATISCGVAFGTHGAINMTKLGSVSSENWQLWYQDNRYFIRNYDYGADWQLGVSEGSPYVPMLLAASGDLGQQWEVTELDGSYTLTNLNFATSNNLSDTSGQPLFAISSQSTDIVLESTNDQSGAKWKIEANTGAGTPSDNMLKKLADIQTLQVTSTTTQSSSTQTQTSISTSLPASSTSTSDSLSNPTGSAAINAASSKSLSAGAIAGIVIGPVVLAILLVILAAFFWRRRRQSQNRPTSINSTQGPFMLEADNGANGPYMLEANQPKGAYTLEHDGPPRY